jgi:glutamate formiminotransferase/formiminotetrahydrofolate cyclodeaminase
MCWTCIGAPQAVEEMAFQGIATAAELIDLNHHRGGHPRFGATDVVPFVPVRGVTLDDCVALARHLGERVGEELGIPVYLYEEAAMRPERRDLANVRRGEYEGLRQDIASNPSRAPDFGPAQIGTAGAPAKALARAVRHSTGGLRFAKALGLLVDGQAQVSMNLTDYHHTPIYRVLELIRAEAARYGLSITQSEIVGLLPSQALIDAAQFYLQLHGFSPDQILENRLPE